MAESIIENQVKLSEKIRKSQAALEYLILVGIVITLMIPLWYYLSTVTNLNKDDLNHSYARVAVNKIKDAADIVFVQGKPAKMKILVTFPEGINSTQIQSKEVLMKIYYNGQVTDVYAVSVANLNGTLPTIPGVFEITVEASDNYVNIYTE